MGDPIRRGRQEDWPDNINHDDGNFVRWMKEAGFSAVRVEHLVGPDSMVIGLK